MASPASPSHRPLPVEAVEAPPPIVEEEILAEGYVCETCGSTRITCNTESRPTTSYGTSEFRQILFLDCLDCGRSWQED